MLDDVVGVRPSLQATWSDEADLARRLPDEVVTALLGRLGGSAYAREERIMVASPPESQPEHMARRNTRPSAWTGRLTSSVSSRMLTELPLGSTPPPWLDRSGEM